MAAPITRQGALASYPNPPGDKNWAVQLLNGPASYTQITAGAGGTAPPTGGWVVKASDLGLTSIDFAWVALSNDGKYEALPFPSTAQNAPQTQLRFMITIAATGAQESGAVNISSQSFMIIAVGE